MRTPGDIVEVQITDAKAYDLLGTVVPKEFVDLADGTLRLGSRA